MAFKERFKTLRQTKNVSQKDLALEFNVTQTTISKWEIGDREPSYNKLKMIADYFQVTVDYLLSDETYDDQINTQLFDDQKTSEVYIAMSFTKLLNLKNEHSKKLTLEIMKNIVHLSTPQLEALDALIKSIK